MDRKCIQIGCKNPIYWKKPFCSPCLHKSIQIWKCQTCNTRLDSAHNSTLKKKCNFCSKEINLMRQRTIRRNRPRTRGYIISGMYKGFHKTRGIKGSGKGLYKKRLEFFAKHPELIGLKRLVTVYDI